MDILSSGDYPPLKCQVSQKLDQLQYSTKKYYIRQARLAIELVCESIAPCQGRDLMHQVFDSIPKEKPKQSDAITETVISAYMKAEDHTTKVQILSIIVGQYTKSELLSLVEGLTLYKIDAARKYAATHGPGQYITPPKITRVRIPKEKIHHFIQFISSPAYLQVVGFGSRHLKLSSGLSVKIPKVIRTMIASRLITAYDTYCKENSIIPPSRATLYKIIKACPASQLKSLHGLDNYISDGMDGIDTLKKLISSLAMKGLSESKVAEIQKMMETLKVHLKNEFKSHISPSSDCIHHCTQFALSEKECDHVHNASCQLCETMYHVKLEIADLVKRTTFNSTQDKEETNHDFELAIEKIWAWRDHSIRTVNQDLCRENIIQNLQEHEVMIIADWAMKYLPQTFRETQSEWFGKQGISWHMICGILCQAQSTTEDKEDQKNVEIVSIVHLVEEGKQGWHLVSQIFSNAFKVLKSIHPHLRDAYIRSDNAGCYHSLPMLSFLWKFRNELPLVVKQYDFSEAQSGKDLCDSRTGSCRLHMLNYINEGHDITNTLQMKEALESHGGIRNTYVSIVSPTSPIDTQPILCGQLKNFQISKYNNFSFEDEGLRAYKAYGIGGELINASDISRISEQLSLADEKLVFSDPKQPDFKAAYIRGSTTRDNFSCIEPDCIRVFKKENQLIHHLAVGKHVYDDENLDNLKDRSMRIWSSQCQELQLNQPVSCYGVEISESNFFAECPGYALKKRKKAVRFSPKVKNYLSVLYNHGEESGKKPSPFTISKQMRCETDVDGNCLFSPAEWLSHQQIRSFFGSLCMKKQREAERSGKSPDIKKDDNLEEDEDLQNIISDLVAHEHQSLLSNIVKELTF
ncbi:uncharacterized protein LOC134276582 [Saccostrea cucullata]|uniref:uncharacterized protein LOC134276582 n=1 Tax=Saccostrea cuccullata TaxID=36930 RepID=UPI002ED57F4A